MPFAFYNLWLAWTGLPLKTDAQRKAFAQGALLLREVEQIYEEQVRSTGQKVASPGRLKARLFALHFPMSAMMLALGSEKHAASEAVYRCLLNVAFYGVPLPLAEKKQMASAILQEQTRSLVSEFRNVGAGQFALAAIYEQALLHSLGELPADGRLGGENVATVLGRVTGQCLAVWAALYQELADAPIQVYTEGFAPTERDRKPFGEDGTM
jgi:hypothetical protein